MSSRVSHIRVFSSVNLELTHLHFASIVHYVDNDISVSVSVSVLVQNLTRIMG